MIRKFIAGLALAAATFAPGFTPSAQAETYPERPITVIVPFGAGGEADIVGRLLATEMSKILGQNVAVQNIVGASGLNGMNAVATAKPDGYTLGFCPSAPLAIHPHMRKLPYSIDTFNIIGRAVNAPYYIVTPKSAPWNNTEELIKAVKADPSKFFWASAGAGSVPFLAELAFFKQYGMPSTNHVPFNGDADAFQALAGNRAQLYATTAGTIKNFEVKPLVLLNTERDPAFPDCPTSKEEGKDLVISQWTCLFAPKNVPADVIATLSAAMKQACESPAFAEALEKLGLAPGYLNTADTLAFIQKESDRNKALLMSLAGK
ncbi:tripartite tricarboxylate transporter substrate binding protein [Mailhella massiliensis]|uniref:Tripartite tricarboxylate transporter substrate binding protein n=1 Tax=Mailhella massiliensis TaxID=1903261 RepID=A0A921DSG5_9BACT|nr:tripartite tricarboxylate transporter substrate binding protein [Mailhella massiliensis]HJD98133.1 tripartite tricarboxylate transporter substrate binding protein [Mailhella massiliensis]